MARGRRHFPLHITISTLLVALLVLALGGAVAIALFVRSRTLAATSERIQQSVARDVAASIAQRVEPAEGILRESQRLAAAGHLPLEDSAALAERLGERIRYDDRFEWLAYLSAEGGGGGAVRSPNGLQLLYVERPEDGGDLELVVESLAEDGTREIVERRPGGMAPFRQVAWYEAGAASEVPAWSKRYIRPFDGTYGRACGLAFRRDGHVEGVFGLGYGEAFLSELFGSIPVGKTGAVFGVSAKTGALTVSGSEAVRARLGPVVERAVAALAGGVLTLEPGHPVQAAVEYDGVDYAVVLDKQLLHGQLQWVNAIVVPVDELVGYMNQYLPYALAAMGLLLLVAIALASFLATRISRPLKEIAKDLERVGDFELTSDQPPSSLIREVDVVGEAVDRMKASLRSFGRYVPTDLVRDLLARGQEARLDGSPRPLTLLFSDVKGFTSVSEGMSAQRLVEALGAYLDVVTTAIVADRGTIDKFMGDGVLAFFNAPHEDAEHARHACHAALRVQRALAAARPGWEERGLPAFLTRIGLHTDEVVVGNIGTPERFSYTVLGDGVNLAARLESVNKAYGTWILASDATRQDAGEGFVWREVDRTAVMGRAEGVGIHELLGVEGDVEAGLLAARDAYQEGLHHYLERRFDEAARAFGSAARLRVGDLAAETLHARALAYAETPPPPDWNGVYVQTHK